MSEFEDWEPRRKPKKRKKKLLLRFGIVSVVFLVAWIFVDSLRGSSFSTQIPKSFASEEKIPPTETTQDLLSRMTQQDTKGDEETDSERLEDEPQVSSPTTVTPSIFTKENTVAVPKSSLSDTLASTSLKPTSSVPRTASSLSTTSETTAVKKSSSQDIEFGFGSRPLKSVRVNFRLLTPPTQDLSYLWALEVGFAENGKIKGNGRLSLFHSPQYPFNRAIKWVAYSPSDSLTVQNFKWETDQVYTLQVDKLAGNTWRASLLNQRTGEQTVLKEFVNAAESIQYAKLRTEVSGGCDDAATSVQWDDFRGYDLDAERVTLVPSVRTQSAAQKGCIALEATTFKEGYLQNTKP